MWSGAGRAAREKPVEGLLSHDLAMCNLTRTELSANYRRLLGFLEGFESSPKKAKSYHPIPKAFRLKAP